jgi:hypothetical protein
MQGTFQGSVQTTSPTTGKVYHKVTIDGKSYNVFKNLAAGLIPGQQVEYGTSQNGQYTNLTSLVAVGNTAPVPQTVPVVAPAIPFLTTPAPTVLVPSNGNGKDTYITVDRREALRIASELVIARISAPNGPKQTPQLARMLAEVTALADHLVAYVQTGTAEPLSAEEVAKLKEVVTGE